MTTDRQTAYLTAALRSLPDRLPAPLAAGGAQGMNGCAKWSAWSVNRE